MFLLEIGRIKGKDVIYHQLLLREEYVRVL